MEATGKHNFIGKHEDELSFNKNTSIKILNMEDDSNWFKAEIDGRVGVVPVNYITMKPHPWYHGSISRSEAQDRLLQVNSNGQYVQTDGAFLVRASETSPGDFSLSVKIGDAIEHFKVLRDASNKFFLWVAKFDTLNGLIDHHRGASVCRSQNVFLKDMVKEEVKAKYEYQAKTDEELSIKPGDVITVVDKGDPNWWKGEIVQGGVRKTGFFPVTYTSGQQ